MIKFVLESFHVQDEEIQTIHLPAVFSALSEIIRVSEISCLIDHSFWTSHRYTSKKIPREPRSHL
jgi:hypothetical protein